jgi:CHAT domain-containing protein
LARAFAVAGASSLIVSLWTVPQEVPEQIFDFHAAWLEQGLGKAQALRRVQLKWMRNWREQPNVWAALALYGRAR